MKIKRGKGKTSYGPGVDVQLSGDELAQAIIAYLVSHNVEIYGVRTVTVNGSLCESATVYVDPSGFVMGKGKRYSGDGTVTE